MGGGKKEGRKEEKNETKKKGKEGKIKKWKKEKGMLEGRKNGEKKDRKEKQETKSERENKRNTKVCRTKGWKKERLERRLVGWLVGRLLLWHINLCRLFNAKSILIQIASSISNNSV